MQEETFKEGQEILKKSLQEEKPIEAKPVQPELTEAQKQKIEKAKVYYAAIQSGQAFLKYVWNDLDKAVNKELDRAKAKRMRKDLRKGLITREVVEAYEGKIDSICAYLEEQAKRIKQTNEIKKASRKTLKIK